MTEVAYGKNILIAGACAGVAEHTIMFPIDLIKTRLQSMAKRGAYKNAYDAFRQIGRREGVRGLLSGINVVLLFTGPAHALHYSTYELVKSTINVPGANYAFAGCCAALVHDVFMNPVEVVKQRLQVKDPLYRGMGRCIRGVYRSEGLCGFYRSFPVTLSINLPYGLIHFPAYEYFLHRFQGNRDPHFLYNLAAGAFSGGLAAGLTTPLDVLRTLINTQERAVVLSEGTVTVRNAAYTVYKFKGVSGFWMGLGPRVVHAVPSAGISWAIYEILKRFLVLPDEFIFD